MTINESALATNQGTPNNEADHRQLQQEYSINCQLALKLAARGWFVFPCREKPGAPYKNKKGEIITPAKKSPYWNKSDLPHGKDNATTSQAQIIAWWKRWPEALIGIYCEQSNIFALDLDCKGNKNGLESLQALISQYSNGEEFHYGPSQVTPSGGKHIIFRHPVEIFVPNNESILAPGIDLRSDGYFCTGGPYHWEENHAPDTPLTNAPTWLLRLIQNLSKPKRITPHLPPMTPNPGNTPQDKLSWAQGMLDLLAPYRCVDYHSWIRVGMALSELGESGFSLWDAWSKGCPEKYSSGACTKRWKSFKPGKGITLGSLYYMFQEDNPNMSVNTPGMIETRNYSRQEVPEPEFAPWDENLLEAPPVQAATELQAPPESKPSDDFFVPDLPKEARIPDNMLKNLENYGRWLTNYVKFASEASPMSAPEFHLILGLTMIATATARRVKLLASTDEIFPNLYSLIVGSSGDAKSSATKIALKVLRQAKLNPLTLPGYMSPQGFLNELIGRPPDSQTLMDDDERESWNITKMFAAQRSLILDEGAILFDWFNLQHMAGMKSLVLRLYDCPKEEGETVISRGQAKAKNCYLNICGISTPTDLAPFLKSKEHWGNGIWARFIFVTPSWKNPPWVFYPEALPIPDEIPLVLTKLFQKLPMPKEGKPPEALSVDLAPGVWDMWARYTKALRYDLVNSKDLSIRYHSSYKRIPMFAMKVSMLLATIDWACDKNSTITIDQKHFVRGQVLAEQWRKSLHRLLEIPNRDGEEETLESKVLRKVPTNASGEVITSRELAIALNMSDVTERFKLDNLLLQLKKDDLIKNKVISGKKSKLEDTWCKA